MIFLATSSIFLIFCRVFQAGQRSELWHGPCPPPHDLAEHYLPASTTRFKLPISISNLACPVEPGNTTEWTEKERLVAEKAEEIKSLEEFLARVSVQHIQLDIFNTNYADEYHGACKKRPVHQNFHRYLE